MENKELWSTLKEYGGVEVSSTGRIKKLASRRNKERILSVFSKDRDGYYKVNVLKPDGSWTQQYVHRLVALAFVENPDCKPCVNHINGDRNDNRVENLEWVTPRENVIHSFRHGKRKACKNVPTKTILTDFQISQIDKLREIYSVSAIAKLFNIEYQSLKNIIHKKKQRERLDDQQPSNYNSIYN